MGILVRPLDAPNRERAVTEFTRVWGAPVVARRGELMDLATLDTLLAASDDGTWLGLLTHQLSDEGLEVVTIQSHQEGIGVGRALMDAALGRAADAGANRLWLSTTNDNVRAIRFYQQWGMDLCAVLFDGVARSRQVKPIIPLVGEHGIALRHELEFHRPVEPAQVKT